jgi:hypothetical protein
MKIALRVALIVLLVSGLSGLASAGEKTRTMTGEVVGVQQGAPSPDGGPWNEVTLQLRNGEQARLRLGPAGETGVACQVGDQVRARVMAGEPRDGAYDVRGLRNRATGEHVQFRDAQGNLVQTRTRTRTGSQAGTGQQVRTRARVQDPGAGGCTSGSGAGGGGGRRGGR